MQLTIIFCPFNRLKYLKLVKNADLGPREEKTPANMHNCEAGIGDLEYFFQENKVNLN